MEVAVREVNEMADAAINDLCDDPQVWLTHGLPNEPKLGRIKKRIAEAIIASRNEATEKAAKLCEACFQEPDWAWYERQLADKLAAAIRALKVQS